MRNEAKSNLCVTSKVGLKSPPPHHIIEPRVLSNEISARILEHALWMQKEGYRPATIKAVVKTLRAVGRRCNILRPEEIKGYLVKANYGENRKGKILSQLRKTKAKDSRPIAEPTD